MMKTGWLWALGVLLIAGYVVPYTVLAGVERWSGPFLFWLVFGVLVWAILSLVVLRWRVGPTASPIDEHGDQP
jgi:hypothetical protein